MRPFVLISAALALAACGGEATVAQTPGQPLETQIGRAHV